MSLSVPPHRLQTSPIRMLCVVQIEGAEVSSLQTARSAYRFDWRSTLKARAEACVRPQPHAPLRVRADGTTGTTGWRCFVH
jgi:hypothetical protein